MARNKLAGTKKGTSKSARYLQSNKKARDRKKKYDTKYHKTKKMRRYRALLNKINRKKGTYGNGDGLDEAHVSKTKTKQQDQSKNRGDKKRVFFRLKKKKNKKCKKCD
tara:strand:+ start:482 stop:805 length:324 start_codon:yes stop_codon:yes gene_type:complete